MGDRARAAGANPAVGLVLRGLVRRRAAGLEKKLRAYEADAVGVCGFGRRDRQAPEC